MSAEPVAKVMSTPVTRPGIEELRERIRRLDGSLSLCPGPRASETRVISRVANIIRACQELPGQELLQYIDEEGDRWRGPPRLGGRNATVERCVLNRPS
jgi:DNA topoisomerase IB